MFEVCERMPLGFAVTSLYVRSGGGLSDTLFEPGDAESRDGNPSQ